MVIPTSVVKDKRYENLCKKLCGNLDEWQDLWQDVLLKLASSKKECYESETDGWWYIYIVRTIYSVYGDKQRKRSVNIIYLPDYDILDDKIDESRDIIKEAVNELHNLMIEKQKGAVELWSACHTNIHTVSKDKGQTFYKTKKEIEPIIKQIKRKLNE